MIKKETDRQNYSILAGEGAILRILKEIDKDINKLMEVLTSLLDLEYTENENVQ